MTMAWMKRDGERAAFLEPIKRSLAELLEETHQYRAAQIMLCMAFTEFFAKQERIGRPLYDHASRQDTPLKTFLFDSVWTAVQAFAREPEEAMALMADLFKWSSESVIVLIRGPLEIQQICNPGSIFDGHRSTDEVDLDDSGAPKDSLVATRL